MPAAPPEPSPAAADRLMREPNIWLASVRPDGRPHLVPIWFVYVAGQIYLCMQPESVKARNIAASPQVSLALESGSAPIVVEGAAAEVPRPWPPAAIAAFHTKYQWDIAADEEYGLLLAVTPVKWLFV